MNRAYLSRSKSLLYTCNFHKPLSLYPYNLHTSVATREKKTARLIHQECQAVLRLLERSKISVPSVLQGNQCFWGQQRRLLSTSSSNNRQGPSSEDNKNDQDEKNKNKMSPLMKGAIFLLSGYLCLLFASLLFPEGNKQDNLRYVAWNEFLHHMLAKGEVESLVVRPELGIVTITVHDNAIIKERPVHYKTFHMNIVDVDKFEEKLRQAEKDLGIGVDRGVPLVYERSRDSAWLLLISLVAVALMVLLLSRGSFPVDMPTDIFRSLRQARFTIVDPLTGSGKGVWFKDVAGLKEAKIEVMEFVDYLKRPEKYKTLGAKVPRGALLLGPPGCGKTMLAKAVATESNVPFLAMAGSEFIEMIGGLGAARVRDLFKEGRKRSPCIIYIDEIDAIGRKRSMK